MDARLTQLMKELGDAIHGSLSESERVAQVIAKIKDEGYDTFLVLEATVGVNSRDENPGTGTPELVGIRRERPEPELAMTAHDVRFLKSLHISVESSK